MSVVDSDSSGSVQKIPEKSTSLEATAPEIVKDSGSLEPTEVVEREVANITTLAVGSAAKSADAVQNDNEWHELLPKLKLSGMALQLAEHCLVKQLTDDKLILSLEAGGGTLKTRLTEETLSSALATYFGHPVLLAFDTVETTAETPAQRRVRHQGELQRQAEDAIAQDAFVRQLKEQFGGVVIPGSVRPSQSCAGD